jgi:HAD superfamily hydrolase (TIGR01509 family)
MKFNPRAILFDLDGVIVNSENVWLISLNKTLEYYNKQNINVSIFNKRFWGNDVNNTLKVLNLPKKALDIVNDFYVENIDKVEIFSDVKSTLENLNNYKKAVITNTPKNIAVYLLIKFDILKYFDFIVTSDDVKYGKPNSEIIIKACNLLNIKTSEIIIIGDTISDIEAGKSIGSTVIGIKINADYYINKISDILKLLDL